MNSFRSVERAIAFEIERQAAALDAGEPLIQETRGWDEDRGETYRMRVQGDSRRLPLLPGARPAAAPRRPGLARRDPRRAAGAAGGPPGALPRRRSGCRPTTRRCSSPSRGRNGAVRGDPGGGRRRSSRSPSRTGSPASTCACATGRPEAAVARRRRRARRPDRPCRGRRAVAGRTRRRSSRSTPRRASRGRVDRRARGLPPDLGRGRARRGRRRGASRRTRRRSRTTGPARPGRRVPRRPGHEGDARPGERGARPGRRPRAARADGGGPTDGPDQHRAVGRRASRSSSIGYQRFRGPWARYQALKDAGRQRRPLRGVARRRPGHDGTTGASVAMADPAAPGPDRRRDRDRRGRPGLPRVPDQVGRAPSRRRSQRPSPVSR